MEILNPFYGPVRSFAGAKQSSSLVLAIAFLTHVTTSSNRLELVVLVLGLEVIRGRRSLMRLDICCFACRNVVGKGRNAVGWEEALGSPGRMSHLARKQRLATLNGNRFGLGDPHEGEHAKRMSDGTLDAGDDQNLRGQEAERREEKEHSVRAHVGADHVREDQCEDELIMHGQPETRKFASRWTYTEEPLQGGGKGTSDGPKTGWENF